MEVERLLSTARPAPTPDDIAAALAAGRVADTNGLGPQDSGYQPTFDTDLAAADLCEVIGMRAAMGGTVTEWSSEGTTVKTAAPDWSGMAARFRARSATVQAASGPGSWGFITVSSGQQAGLPPRSAEFER